ncbi:MAG: primosomal protein N' [Methylohalobius crimeensis]
MTTILKVAVPAPIPTVFDYLPPQAASPKPPLPGTRLKIPFGRKHRIGVLLGVDTTSDIDPKRLRPAVEFLDRAPLLGAEDLALLRWSARYYHHPIGEVTLSALPNLLRQGKSARLHTGIQLRLTSVGHTAIPSARATKQAALLSLLRQYDGMLTAAHLSDLTWDWRAPAKALRDKGWLSIEAESLEAGANLPPSFQPNSAQQQAIDAVAQDLDRFRAYLLEGVTGSGKTEVYLGIIERTIELGRQVLVLFPEIALTPQLETRFRRRLTCSIGVFHSALSDTQRLNAWLRFQRGELPILLGTRSAVFTPMAQPGLILIDEEHDPSLKQQEGFRFSARDVAVMRARRLNIPIVLGSATPSLESLYNVRQNRYLRLHLARRAGSAQAPTLQQVDIRNRKLRAGLAPATQKTVQATLARGEQVLLFLNRRGFAPVLTCHNCGWIAVCPRCDARQVIHRRDRHLRCHHCGNEGLLPTRCPDCRSEDLRALGQGTERLEIELSELFPHNRIARIDRDATRRKGSLDKLIEAVHAGEIDLLLGTQMLAKGHHFPNVTLAVIVDADAGLYSTDFRAPERMAQLIVQVAGRAGRADKPGQVLIQTRHPDHPLLTALLQGGYSTFANQALEERRQANLPPYTQQALLRAEANDPAIPLQFLEQAANCAHSLGGPDMLILGPAPAPMPKRAGRHRAQLLLQATARASLHRLLDGLLPQLGDLPNARKVRWSLDVDPLDLY